MNDKYKRLMKNSVVFMIANFGSKLLSFILVPFYTHVLSTGEYGTVDALIATVSLFSPIATFGIGDVIVMFLSKKEYDAQKIFVNSTILIILGNILVALVYPLIFLSDIFNGYMLYFVALVFASSIYGVLQMYARGTDKVTECAISGVLYTVVLATSNIVFLLWLKSGIPGYLTSAILAYLIPALYLLIIVKGKSLNLRLFDKKLIHNILVLSIPLIPTTVLWSLMNLADKYTILWFMDASANGIYAVAHKIPTIISVIYGIFQQAWQLTTFELDSKEERSNAYSKLFELLTGIMFCVGAILLVVNRLYVTYLCESSYIDAWKISPILMYSSILNCLSGFIGSNYLIMHDTKSALKVTLGGALINVILNFVFVPLIGLYGAAIATCIGYLFMVIKKYFDTAKFTPLNIKFKRYIMSNLIIIFMCLTVTISNNYVFYVVNVIAVGFMLLNYRDQYRKVIELTVNIIKRK